MCVGLVDRMRDGDGVQMEWRGKGSVCRGEDGCFGGIVGRYDIGVSWIGGAELGILGLRAMVETGGMVRRCEMRPEKREVVITSFRKFRTAESLDLEVGR